ncbi:J domain-containing protein [Govanella unica]|uniref:J domain-containing protein n=1 Tax=Govanella unica TaxID=2975056 RepID=A0A9X3TYB2_9PROT|nr:J domain-containing protein [Govania unica]MDA5194036.1 J domain-containing protein [Govania unica]
MKDPYSILGVARSASGADIKKAYRKLAKTLHPDVNPGNEKVSDRFKEVSAAYAILGDEKARGRYDRGEIDENGNDRGFSGFQNAGQGGRRSQQQWQSAGGDGGGFAFDAEDIFADIFSGLRGGRGGGRRGRGPVPERGLDRIYEVMIDFLDAVHGTKKQITLENGKTLAVKIPKDVKEGQQIRLKAQGAPGSNGGANGDALIEVKINPHPLFRREGDDIHLALPITLGEAVLGGKVTVPTISGSVNLTIPPGSNTGKTLRLKARGVENAAGHHGDQYVRLEIILPDQVDEDLRAAIEGWAHKHPYSVRDGLK